MDAKETSYCPVSILARRPDGFFLNASGCCPGSSETSGPVRWNTLGQADVIHANSRPAEESWALGDGQSPPRLSHARSVEIVLFLFLPSLIHPQDHSSDQSLLSVEMKGWEIPRSFLRPSLTSFSLCPSQTLSDAHA